MRRRRAVMVFIGGVVGLLLLAGAVGANIEYTLSHEKPAEVVEPIGNLAMTELESLPVKGRAPKTGYSRDEFGSGWKTVQGCSTRDIILNRDLQNVVVSDGCSVESGILHDPYTGEDILFSRKDSSKVQIDHIVALSDAWQKGAQNLTQESREQLANDPLELWAVSGPANQAKSDGDAATWLPKNKVFRCEYVERQIAVKKKYSLWVTEPEKQAMRSVLQSCT